MAENPNQPDSAPSTHTLSLDPEIPHSYANLFEISVSGNEARIALGRGHPAPGAPAKFDHVIYMTYDTLLEIETVIARIKQDIAANAKKQQTH